MAIAEQLALPADPGVVRDLRRARTRNRMTSFDPFEALYQAYVVAIVVVVAVVFLSGLAGDGPIRGAHLALVARHGPAVVGALVALFVAIGLRSGGRGGPLGLEDADVQHLLLAPVDRRAALRRPCLQQLRFGAFAGAGAGAVVGLVVERRLPGTAAAWVVCGALVGALATTAALGAAMVASGRRVPPNVATLIGLGALAWSGADIYFATLTSPFTLLGRVATWPLHFDWVALIGVAVALALTAAGPALIGGLSLEASLRRTGLVGRARFAVTARDLRTVMVLWRQLAQERPRRRPWLPLPLGGGRGRRLAVWKRGWYGFLRWPGRRVLRLLLLGAIAGLATRGAWSAAVPLVAVAAIALWAAALDAAEPLAEELDSRDRLASYPRPEGWIALRHLAVPFTVMLGVCLVGVAVALPFGQPGVVVEVGLATVIPAASASVLAAAVTLLREPKQVILDPLRPEVTGLGLLLREALPPTIAGAGLIAVLAARAAVHQHHPAIDTAANWAAVSLLVPVAGLGWVQSRGRQVSEPLVRPLGSRV
jgi:hypothetical protein